MKNYAIVTDSAAGLTDDFIKTHDIKVLPMSVIIDGIAYKDGVDKSTEEIYELLRESGEGAKTSQPTVGEFIEVYESIEQDDRYDSILAVHASSQLTGTYQSSLSVSQESAKPAKVIDSKIGSYPMRKMVERAVEGRDDGETLDTVALEIDRMVNTSELYLLPKSFAQLKKSGRVSASQSMFATLLQVQLKLKLEDGKVIIGEKVRTRKKMMANILNNLEEHVKDDAIKSLSIVYAGTESLTDEWSARIRERLPHLNLSFEPLVTVAGVHTGYGTVGFAFIKGR